VLYKFIKNWSDENAFTGLEASIVMIAFIVLAAVFSFVVLGSGFTTTQKSQEVVYSSVTQASSSLALDGDVIAKGATGGGTADELTFYVTNTAGGTPVDLAKTIITYAGVNSFTTFPYNATNGSWFYTPVIKKGNANNLVEQGDVYKIILSLDGSTASSNQNYSFASKWGSLGASDGHFNRPNGIAVDSSGNIYVTDLINYRIQKFDSNGNFITTWGSLGASDGRFKSPANIAIGSSGSVYVADQLNHRIQKFDSSGTFLTKWGSSGTGDGEFMDPFGIAVDLSGNVYVADGFTNCIQKFDSSGTFLTKWGSYGSGDGQLSTPAGIAVDSSGNIYVVDYDNNRIQKFDSSGTFLSKWGSSGTGDGQLDSSLFIAVDSSQNVYVSDQLNERIQKFDSSGTFLTKWGSFGAGDGEFNLPRGIAIDSSGNIYVSDNLNHRIQKFKLNRSSSSPASGGSSLPGVNEQVKLEVKPPEGAVLTITKTMPPALADGIYYQVY
jgi:archaellin